MPYTHLPKLIEREGPNFYRVERRWQPKDLIPDPYRRNLLKDAQSRYELLEKSEDELQTLIYPDRYIKILRSMRLTMRKAHFAWRSDDLEFLRNISDFFKGYGTILRLLKIEEARGRFDESQ